jgi:uncharacterized cupin superfamily protein
MPRIDLDTIAPRTGSDYPQPYNLATQKRLVRPLSKLAGLTDFEVNHVVLPPGAWSSQRHWHEREDEFLVMIAGHAWLVDEQGRTPLAAADCVAFPKKDRNGHHIIAGDAGCIFVVVGVAEASPCHYPDIDLFYDAASDAYLHKDGTRY